jgi:hypothetical protein
MVPESPEMTASQAIIEVLEFAGGYGAKLTPLHRGVEAVIGKVSRGKVQSEAGELGKDRRVWFDITSDKYYLAGVEPEVPEDDTEPRLSVQIVDLLMETYRVGRSTDGKPFIVGRGSHVVTAVSTRRFKELIASLSWNEFRTPATKSVVEEVASVITGMAFAEDPVKVWHRVALVGRDCVVIDLGQIAERVVVANALGWTLEDKSPGPMFIRTELTAAMPTPLTGASADELWNVIRVAEDRRDLMLGLLASALVPEVPHLILSLVGEQGTAKTETLRAISLLIDPLTAPTRTLPSDVRDLAVTLAGSWAVAFDNVSHIRADISDALCRSVTGDSFVARALYTDAEISAITYQRVIMMDGIDLGVLRGDFLDRAVLMTLETIPEDERRTLFTWNDGNLGVRDFFTGQQPRLFGAVLDALVDILHGLHLVDTSTLPRMADAAVLLAAMDQSRGTDSAKQYREAREDNIVLGVESDQVAIRVRDYAVKMHRARGDEGTVASDNGVHTWVGSSSQLMENTRPSEVPKGWPTTAQHFSGRLRRAAPGLRAIGIDVAFNRDAQSRTIKVTYSPNGHTPAEVDGDEFGNDDKVAC